MRKKFIPISILILALVLFGSYLIPSVVSAAPVQAQTTPGITVVPPAVTVLPPIVVTGTAVAVVPVTGGGDSTTLLFYGILVLAGMAFVIMLFALMRRPSDKL